MARSMRAACTAAASIASRGAGRSALASLPSQPLAACWPGLLARGFASSSVRPQPSEAPPNYYGVLNINRDATPEQIKSAFRELAKRYHPDLAAHAAPTRDPLVTPGAADDAAVDMFKLINEAYSVLSDPALRRDYDADRFSRTALLRRRNEGWSAAEASAPPRAAEYVAFDSSMGRGAETGGGPGQARGSEEQVRASFARSGARLDEEHRTKASMARTNRTKIVVPTQRESLWALAAPLGVVVLWTFNYLVFFR